MHQNRHTSTIEQVKTTQAKQPPKWAVWVLVLVYVIPFGLGIINEMVSFLLTPREMMKLLPLEMKILLGVLILLELGGFYLVFAVLARKKWASSAFGIILLLLFVLPIFTENIPLALANFVRWLLWVLVLKCKFYPCTFFRDPDSEPSEGVESQA